MFKGMIELYHFFAEYYKTIPGNISIMKLQKHKKTKNYENIFGMNGTVQCNS